MSDVKPTATIKSGQSFSAAWILPLVSIVVGLWMFFQYQSNQGTTITLHLQTADGIEAGKTEIKALDVKIGLVTDVALNDNYSSIIVKAQIDKNAERMLRKDSIFWVVKPRIGKDGVSGLETLLSGSYIALRPGISAAKEYSFDILENPPIAAPDAQGLRLVLFSDMAGKLSVGDPVIYEGYTVGRVEKVGFDLQQSQASYQLFIFKPFDALVYSKTRFWLSSGFDISMNAEGFNVQVGSLETLLSGGVNFKVPEGQDKGDTVTKQMQQFKLYDDQKQALENLYDTIEYALLFNESVRGLTEGAAVEYRGIRIGTVKKVPLHLTSSVAGFSSKQIPVLMDIEVERILNPAQSINAQQLENALTNEFNNGMRASLKTGNLLTGALFVDVDFYPNEKNTSYEKTYRGYRNFPTTSGYFTQFQHQIGNILNKIEKLPIENVLVSLDNTLKESKNTLQTFTSTGNELGLVLKRIDEILAQESTKALPAQLKQSLKSLQLTLSGFDPNSQAYRNLQDALSNLSEALNDVQPLMQKLNQQPNILIFGDKPTADPIPAKGVQP